MAAFPSLKRKKKIVCLGNPNAGLQMGREELRNDLLQMLHDAFAGRNDAAHLSIYFPDSLEKLDDVVEEQVKPAHPDIIAVFGGDGTLQQILKRLLTYLKSRSNPPDILFLGLGTQNIVLKNFGLMSGDPRKAVAMLIKKIQRGIEPDRVHRMVMQINGEYPGFTYGSGITARFLEKYYRKKPGGPRRVFKVAVSTLWRETLGRLNPFQRQPSLFERFGAEVSLTVNGVETRSEMSRFTGIIAGSVEQVGMNCRVTYRALEEPDAFHVVLANLGFWQILPNVWPMFTGQPLNGDVRDAVASKVIIKYGQPMIHMVDGELCKPEDLSDAVTIEPGPYLKLIRLT